MTQGKDKFGIVDINTLEDLSKVIEKNTYSLSRFNNGHRTNGNFIASDFIGLDFDDGLTLNDAVQLFKNYNCIIGTTRNHQKPKNGVTCDRFRVILKLERTITTADEYKSAVNDLLNKHPQADKQCSDAARMFYPCSKIVFLNASGETIKPMTTPPSKTIKAVTEQPPVVKGKLSRNTLGFITFGPESSSTKGTVSNTRLFKAAVDCLEQGYTLEESIQLLLPSVKNYGGEFTSNDLKTIKSAFNRDPKHPPRTKESIFAFKRATEYTGSTEGVNWLVDGFLIEGGLSILAGAPKSGKSTISRQLALAVANGSQFLDRTVKKGKVLYLALEEEENLLVEQFKKIGLTDDSDVMLHVGPIGVGNVIDNMIDAIEGYGASLLVVDTLLLLANFENPNDYNEAYKKLSAFRNIARKTGCHIICLHHQNKGEDRGANSVLGSTAIQGAVDNTIVLNSIRSREAYRKISSFQRGGQRFTNKELKYIEESDMYIISDVNHPDF